MPVSTPKRTPNIVVFAVTPAKQENTARQEPARPAQAPSPNVVHPVAMPPIAATTPVLTHKPTLSTVALVERFAEKDKPAVWADVSTFRVILPTVVLATKPAPWVNPAQPETVVQQASNGVASSASTLSLTTIIAVAAVLPVPTPHNAPPASANAEQERPGATENARTYRSANATVARATTLARAA